MDLATPEDKVRKLQETLQAKAKGTPSYRFYQLYDKVYRADVLAFAYQRSRENGGKPGVDGQTFDDIKEYGGERWLGELAEELRTRTYQPQAVRRAWIPKPDGTQRPLGIPTVKDRVVQTAVLLILEPIFETDLQPEQYAYRPERGDIYMRRFVLGWKVLGHAGRLAAEIVHYADDFVIRYRGTAREALQTTQSMMTQLRLTIPDIGFRSVVVQGHLGPLQYA